MSKNKVINSANTMRKDFISNESNQMLLDSYEIWCMEQNTKLKKEHEKRKSRGN